MEESVARFLVEIPHPAAFIIDCLWNMQAPNVTQNAVPLVKFLRANGLANTPIVLAEGSPAGQAWAAPPTALYQSSVNAALAAAFAELVAGGDKNLYYVKTADLFSPSTTLEGSGTAEGCHVVDSGNHDMAARWTTVLSGIL